MGGYIFPDFLSKIMSKIDFRTQLEAAMLSMSFMMVGLIVTIVYIILYIDFPTWYKIFLMFNGLAGILFMSSYLTTTFQQYKTYMVAVNFQKSLEGGKGNGKI